MSGQRIFDGRIKSYLKDNPRAREILHQAARSDLDMFRIAGHGDTINVDLANEYIFAGGSLLEIQESLQDLLEIGVLGDIFEGFAVPSEYYFLEERSGEEMNVKRNPKFREDLIRLLNEFGD